MEKIDNGQINLRSLIDDNANNVPDNPCDHRFSGSCYVARQSGTHGNPPR